MEMNDHAVRGSVLYQLVRLPLPSFHVSSLHLALSQGSFMNHNCDPNVERSSPSLTSRVTWIASKPIERGDELTIAYVALEDASTFPSIPLLTLRDLVMPARLASIL